MDNPLLFDCPEPPHSRSLPCSSEKVLVLQYCVNLSLVQLYVGAVWKHTMSWKSASTSRCGKPTHLMILQLWQT